MRPTGPIRVLLVDDSALIRAVLTRALSAATDIQVIGGAADPFEARELIIQHRPDVIILDIEMPRMNGLAFLRKLRVHYPVPVIMCSSLTQAGSQATIEALETGAVDVVAKPSVGGRAAMVAMSAELVEKVRAAMESGPPPPPRSPVRIDQKQPTFRSLGLNPDRYLVLIGASTGGTEAIRRLLCAAPPDFPATAMVQHMPEGFTRSFADRLNLLSPLTVSEATGGDPLVTGRAYLARGGLQMVVQGTGGQLRVNYAGSEPVNRHAPSVDVLFESAARPLGRQIIGVILTGMGEDGARGLLKLREGGALTFGQDRTSSVVYGMPKVAFQMGAVGEQASPGDIPRLIMRTLRNTPVTARATS